MGSRLHLLPRKGAWIVKKEGNDEILANGDSKMDVAEAGRRMAREQGAEFVIHNEDGSISDSDSYGNDPAASRDSIH